MYLQFDFELAGVPLPDDEATGINLMEFRKHVILRLTELGVEIDQYPDGVIIMNYFCGTHLDNETYQLKAFRFPDNLCRQNEDLLTEEDFGIIYSNIMAKRNEG